MTQTMTGTVSGIGQKGGGGFFLRGGNDEFYSCREAAQRAGVQAGSEVTFEYETNQSGDRTFYNIKGNVQVGGGAPAAQAGERVQPTKTPVSGGVQGQDLRSRTIYRQNLLTQANSLLATRVAAGLVGPESSCGAESLLTIARALEPYVSGEEG